MPVAYDFRSADVAAGGQGAPLAPVYHAALARELAKPLAVLNIGGVANVTWIGADGELVAFDTGPGNGPLDDWIARRAGSRIRPRRRDRAVRAGRCGGAGAAAGGPLFRAAAAEIAGPAGFRRRARRERARATCRRPTAPRRWWRSPPPRSPRAPLPAPPLRWLVTGGGRHNPAIMAALRDRLGAPVDPVEALGWNGDALEAQCFGFLAARTRAGLPISFPGTTGVPRPMTGGRITAPAPT